MLSKVLYSLLLLLAVFSNPTFSFAEVVGNEISSILVNGKKLKSTLEVISPRISLELGYNISKVQKFEWIRIYRENGCSLQEPFYEASWCKNSPCIIGENQDFDISFESKDDFFHINQQVEKLLNFSVELATRDRYGVRETVCHNAQVKFTPCDKIIKEEFGKPSRDPVKLIFIDKNTKKPVPNVTVLLSSGPIAQFVETEPGVVEMRTVARTGYKFSISRDGKRRFVVGPYKNQLSENRLKSLEVALCAAN